MRQPVQNVEALFMDGMKQRNMRLLRKLIFDENLRTDLIITEYHGMILLKMATESRDASFLLKLLRKLQPDLTTLYGARLLWIVVEDGNIEIASMLVRAGANVNVPRITDPLQHSFLHVLASHKSPKKLGLALLMIERGADVMARDADEFSVLEYAVRYDNFSLASELLKRGAVVDEYVVDEAVYGSNTQEWLSFFIQTHDDKTTQNERLSDMFSWLCQLDYDEEKIAVCLKMLLELGVPQISVVFDAVTYGNTLLAQTVLDADIDRTIKLLLLHPAAMQMTSDITSMLIDWGADIHHRMDMDIFGFSKGGYPMHVACAYGSLENIELLLRLGADVNVSDDHGNTPFSLMINFYPGLGELSRLVIKHFAMLTSKDVKINNVDLDIISRNSDLQNFYDECLTELQMAKELVILNSINFYSIFIKDVEELSYLTRREKFVQNFESRMSMGSFSLYSKDLNLIFRQAENRKKLLSETESILYESLAPYVPELVIEKILYYLYFSVSKCK